MALETNVADYEAHLARVTSLRDGKQTIQAHNLALDLLSSLDSRPDGVGDEVRRRLVGIYTDPPTAWARPYTFPSAEVVTALEHMDGRPKLATAFESLAEPPQRERQVERTLLYLVAAASVYAEFGAAGLPRRFLFDKLSRIAFGAQQFEVALTAAQARLALTEPTDRFSVTLCEQLIGNSLLRLGRKIEAVPYLQQVLATRQTLAQKGVGPKGWVAEAELLLTMATQDSRE